MPRSVIHAPTWFSWSRSQGDRATPMQKSSCSLSTRENSRNGPSRTPDTGSCNTFEKKAASIAMGGRTACVWLSLSYKHLHLSSSAPFRLPSHMRSQTQTFPLHPPPPLSPIWGHITVWDTSVWVTKVGQQDQGDLFSSTQGLAWAKPDTRWRRTAPTQIQIWVSSV